MSESKQGIEKRERERFGGVSLGKDLSRLFGGDVRLQLSGGERFLKRSDRDNPDVPMLTPPTAKGSGFGGLESSGESKTWSGSKITPF